MKRVSGAILAGLAGALLACAPGEPEPQATAGDAGAPGDTVAAGNASPTPVVPAPDANAPAPPATGPAGAPARPGDIVGHDSVHPYPERVIPLKPDTVYR